MKYIPKQHSQMGPSRAHPGPIWGPTLPNWGPTGAHMKCCLGWYVKLKVLLWSKILELTFYGIDFKPIFTMQISVAFGQIAQNILSSDWEFLKSFYGRKYYIYSEKICTMV